MLIPAATGIEVDNSATPRVIPREADQSTPDERQFLLDHSRELIQERQELEEAIHHLQDDIEDDELYALANATGVPFGDTGVVLRIAPRLGDLNADGVVGIEDLLELLAQWGQSGVAGDLDMDGIVGITDLLLLLGNWG